MIHAVAAPGLTARPYFNRYTEDALDLCDVLSSFAPHTKASLNELSKIMGLPGKPDSIDGPRSSDTSSMGRSKRSRTIVKLMSSTPIAFGYGTSYFEVSCPIMPSKQANEFERIHQSAEQRETAFGGVDLKSVLPRGPARLAGDPLLACSILFCGSGCHAATNRYNLRDGAGGSCDGSGDYAWRGRGYNRGMCEKQSECHECRSKQSRTRRPESSNLVLFGFGKVMKSAFHASKSSSDVAQPQAN